MTDYELELIKIIRGSHDPEKTIMKAAEIMVEFLRQHGSSVEQAASDHLEYV